MIYVNTRQRQGYEIDARARRLEFVGTGGVDVRVGGKTTLRTAGGHEAYRFESEEALVGSSLSTELIATPTSSPWRCAAR